MSISNYTELQTEIASWMNRDDLTAQIPHFIQLCETHLNEDLRVREMIEQTTVTTSTTDNYISLPTGHIETIAFNDDDGTPLTEVTLEEIYALRESRGAGQPEYYALSDQIDFERVDSEARSYSMAYYKELDLATTTTNSILTNWPNIYLFGSLFMGAIRVKDTSMIEYYQGLYQSALDKAEIRSLKHKRALRTDHPLKGRRFDIVRGC
jgi:hypothetical protein